MSGKDLIDDYLSELMDDPGKGKPETSPAPAAADSGKTAEPAPPIEAATSPPEHIDPPQQMAAPAPPAPAPAPPAEPAGDALAAFRSGSPTISDDEFEAMLDVLDGKAPAAAPAPAPAAGDPLAAFRDGAPTIDDSEFEAMLDALQGKPAAAPAAANAPAAAAVATPAHVGDPLAEFRTGDPMISDDEFEAMLDVLQAAPPAAAAPPPAAVAPAPAPPPAVLEALLPPRQPAPAAVEMPQAPERRRRADDRITSWLRFSLARQHFAVEVLKVQEVLRVPHILPVRGTSEAMLGVMNLRGQIVPVMDLAIKLGFAATEANDSSRVIVLEENGETLGLLVASVADVVNLSDGKMERISGTPSLVAAEVVRGISRRDGQIVIMLDATRLLA